MEELEEVVVKNLGVLSLGNILSIIGIFTGLIFGAITIIIFSVYPNIPYVERYASWMYFSIVAFPIIFGIIGFVSGIILALFYNLAAKVAKGVHLYS